MLAQIPDIADKLATASKSTDYSLVGVLIVAMVAIGWVTYQSGRTLSSWIAREIIIPGRDKFFGHLEKVNVSMDGLNHSLQALRLIPERLDRIEVKVDTLGERVDRVDEHLIRQDAKTDAHYQRVS